MHLEYKPKVEDQINKIKYWTLGLGRIVNNIGKQLDDVAIGRHSRFYIDMLKRTVRILNDIYFILPQQDKSKLVSVFILTRSLLDDFIILLHLKNNNYDEEELIKYEADKWYHYFNTIKEDAGINKKYFNSMQGRMATEQSSKEQFENFKTAPENQIYFTDGKWKTFPKTRELIISLPNTELGKNNAHAFVLWKYFSGYTHFSPIVSKFDEDYAWRYIELLHLQEAYSYFYKTIYTISDVLKTKYGYKHQFLDPEGIQDSINSNEPE